MLKLVEKFVKARKAAPLRTGMTLIEIMIVVTLMVSIMGLIGFNVIGQADKANAGIAETQLKNLKQNCEAYRIQYKKWPENLQALVDTPDNNPIVEEINEDPWGNPYEYEKNGNKIKIYSIGMDGTPNTEDDIVVNFGRK